MEHKKLISDTGLAFDILLAVLFFVFMTFICMDHVPAETQKFKTLFGAFAATPISCVFWMAINFLRVTWVDMKRRRAEGKDY